MPLLILLSLVLWNQKSKLIIIKRSCYLNKQVLIVEITDHQDVIIKNLVGKQTLCGITTTVVSLNNIAIGSLMLNITSVSAFPKKVLTNSNGKLNGVIFNKELGKEMFRE